MKTEVQRRIHKGSPIVSTLRINPIPRIDTYLLKVHINIWIDGIIDDIKKPQFSTKT